MWGGAVAQTEQPTDWADVCVSEDLLNYRDALCKKTFIVSSLAFNPLGPRKVANMTVLLQPSAKIPEDSWLTRIQYVDLYLPGFDPVGTQNIGMATKRDLTLTPMNVLDVDVPALESYNTVVNPLFDGKAVYDTLSGVMRLTLRSRYQMLPDRDTEVRICCVRLPNESPPSDPKYRISAPTNDGAAAISIRDEPVKSTPYIDPGFQFEFLQLVFDPPVSKQLCTISFTLRPANDLKDRQQVILHMPQITRVQDEDGIIGFSTAESAEPLDWMLFSSQALWNNTGRSIAFFLRAGQVLRAGRQVTLQTLPGEFQLPVEIEQNAQDIVAEARSLDSIDEIIAPTPVDQSSNVPHVRMFPYSELTYADVTPNAQTDVTFSFRTNRPMFVNTQMYLRLSGFRSDVVDVVLLGPTQFHFQNRMARYHLPENLMELNVTRNLYSNEINTDIVFSRMFLPPAMYANDKSILIWTSDPDAVKQPLQISPELCSTAVCGGEQKTFTRSQISFEPAEPRLPANVTFTIQPSIFFYEGDQIVLHLYGFVCQSTFIPLIGPGASKIESNAAIWYGDEYMLVLTVGKNQLVDNASPLIIMIGLDQNFRLPGLLSKNDGTLRIEGRGALIEEAPLRKVPAMGDPKLVISSRVDIEPVWSTSAVTPYARIVISFILNSDVLPNSVLSIKLGGILRNPPNVASTPIGFSAGRSGNVVLSGKNAPLFFNTGYWNHDTCVLTLRVKPEYIYAGEYTRFFLERDMYFQLPPAAYSADPAFRIAIPGAGIAEEKFLYSTKWVDQEKMFDETELFYGDPDSVVWYPGDVPDLSFKFRPNVDLYAGTVIALKLPGFQHSLPIVQFSPPETAVADEYDISGFIPTAEWDQITYELRITVPVGNAVVRRTNILRVRALGNAGFMLPLTALARDDPRLTIRCYNNQYIKEEPIKISPRVVQRTFLVSKFEYLPPIKESIFLFIMRLQPAVNISWPQDIEIQLRGFRNSLSKQKIEITGASRHYINQAEGLWNESTEILKLPMIFNGDVINADEMLEFKIEESQGFILPSKLQKNDPSVRITSLNNILWEPVKESPMVGNQPYSPHRFCMLQYEDAVRTQFPICSTAKDCNPPLTDPCNPEELTRCGCDSRLDEKFNFTIQGFNLEDTDTMHFVPYEQLCNDSYTPPYLSSFNQQQYKPITTKERDSATFYGFRSIHAGYFRMCYSHVGSLFDVGIVSVRPSCESPYVMVGGTCVEHCPKSKIPVAGQCLRDPLALSDEDGQALMLPVVMSDPAVAGSHLSERETQDQEVRYFVYRFTYELARLLNCEPSRIKVASLSKGSTVVNAIFSTVGDEDVQATTTSRSPAALISLLRALQSDTSSSLYKNVFFQNIQKPQTQMQAVSRAYTLPMRVRLCPDGVYRAYCPYVGEIMDAGASYSIFVIAIFVVPVVLALCCCCCWFLDVDKLREIDEDDYDKLRTTPSAVDRDKQMEFAKSWLEGRFMGEQWERARQSKLLALADRSSKHVAKPQRALLAIGN